MEQVIQTIYAAGGGVSGILLTIIIWKGIPELRAIWRSIDRSSRTDLLRIIAAAHVAPELKDAARDILSESEAEETAGKSREKLPP